MIRGYDNALAPAALVIFLSKSERAPKTKYVIWRKIP